MQIVITTKQIVAVLKVVAWVLFFALAVDAGGIVVNTLITVFLNEQGVQNFWSGKEYLTRLHQFDPGHFAAIAIAMSIVAVLKAILFYLIVKIFSKDIVSMQTPFSEPLRQILILLSYVALGIAMFSQGGADYSRWLSTQGAGEVDISVLRFGGADVWFFMAVVLFAVVYVVKRGIEIQSEHDLTI
ncbi:MAG: hypothetical protein J5I53_06330 [Bradyrhizobiaceae bacterium]|nr:hypothetical protein [Bradyrhizobiaceae bacterium]